MKCLLAISDASIARSVDLWLRSEGFKVETTDEGEEAVELAKLYGYEIVVVSDALDDMLGLDMVRRLRAAKITIPVLMLAREPAAQAEAWALDAGADDYLRMPFHRDVLISRMRAVIRRSQGHATTTIEAGPLQIDLASKQLRIGGKVIHLTGSEYQLLECLALRKGMVLSKEMLLNQLYGGMDEPEIKIIDVFICKVRNKLRGHGAEKHLETSWGRGYRLVETPDEPSPKMEIDPRPKGTVQIAVAKALDAGEQTFFDLRHAAPWANEQTVRNALKTLIDRGAVEKLGAARATTYRLRSAA